MREISLCDKLSILRFWSTDTLSMRDILLLCKSNTYNLVSSFIPRILLIWFFGRSNTFKEGISRFSISFIWLSYKSMYNRFGKEIRFYILFILLCWKVSIFSFYSPSSNGTWFNSKESRFSFSKLDSLSHGRL